MDILKRLAKLTLKKAQRVRDPWAVATSMTEGNNKKNNPGGTPKGAIVEGIKRNEWNSPEGLDGAMERHGEHHGTSSERKKGHSYDKKYKGDNKYDSSKRNTDAVTPEEKKKTKEEYAARKPVTETEMSQETALREAVDSIKDELKTSQKDRTFVYSQIRDALAKITGDSKAETDKDIKDKLTPEEQEKIKDEPPIKDVVEKVPEPKEGDTISKINSKVNEGNINQIRQQVESEVKSVLSVKREGKKPDIADAKNKVQNALDAYSSKATDLSVGYGGESEVKDAAKKIDSALKDLNNFKVEKSTSSSRRLLNILKETTTVNNDQLEKDLISALSQAMKKHSDGFKVPTGNNEILKNIRKQYVKKGIGSALLAMLAGYALTPKVSSGEMTPAQQRQWERTLANQMRKKNIDIDSDTFKALQNFYKDQSDTYTRKKPAKNGVNIEKILTSPPFQGAEFDPTSHRWKKAGQVSAQTGQVNVGTGGKRRIRGAGTGAAQRSVGGHKRGIVREARRGIGARAARRKSDIKSRSSRIKAYKKLTRKK